jgi:hypothetical protein
MECLGGDLPAVDIDGDITFESLSSNKIHKFHTLTAAKKYAEFNDEYIMSNSGEYLGNGSVCSDCRGMTPEYTGGVCQSCLDKDFTK